MLTDEELTTRLSAAFRAEAPELTYAGRLPHVRRGVPGLTATTVVGAAAALALAPAALQHDHLKAPDAAPSTRTTHHAQAHGAVHTLVLGSLRLTYAATAGQGDLSFVGAPGGLTVPADAQKVDLGIPAQVWFAADPAEGDPQVYVLPDGSSTTYGIYGQGWTHQELVDLLQHPVSDQQSSHHQR